MIGTVVSNYRIVEKLGGGGMGVVPGPTSGVIFDGILNRQPIEPLAMGIVSWTADGRGMVMLDDRSGAPNLWTLPFDGSPRKQLTHFPKSEIHNFAWSPDGKRIALSRGSVEQSVVLIKSGP